MNTTKARTDRVPSGPGVSMRPIRIGGFELHARGMDVHGKPSFEDFEAVGLFIKRTHEASGWWLVDWLMYGDGRTDWRERLEQVVDADLLTAESARKYRYVGKRIPPESRIPGSSFSHHHAVVHLEHEERKAWLGRAQTEGWSKHELAAKVRAASRTRVIEGQAVLEGMYRVIYADPPWSYTDSGATIDGSLGKAERSFPGMTMVELMKLPVKAHALPDSILFLWVTATMLYENPGPRDIIEAWGFTPKTGRVWDKVIGMPGHYGLQVKHEHVIIATRGSCLPSEPLPHDDSVFVERRSGEHSEKPEAMRQWITRHWTVGPYLELFGRKRVAGWTVFGNDARLWSEDARVSA